MRDGVPTIDPSSAGVSTQTTGLAWSGLSDWAGMVASIGCAIHCAAMPFVIAYLPAFGLSFLADEAFHKWMAVGCIAIALTAFVPGLRKHGRLTPMLIGSVGLVMISIAAFGFAGACCAACESNPAQLGLATSNVSINAAPSSNVEGCAEDCCLFCVRDGSETVSKDNSTAQLAASILPSWSSSMEQLLGRIASWLTPLGGIVLVAAHLLNRRYGWSCECCENESTAVQATLVCKKTAIKVASNFSDA